MSIVNYVIRGKDGKPYNCEFHFDTAEDLADLVDVDTLLTVPEMAQVIIDDMTPQDHQDMIALSFDELIKLHQGVGRDIRNAFGLWIEGNPNVRDHADDTSMEVLELVWVRLRNKANAGSQVMKF
jgi:hypothetical protein